ncbi:6-phosphogluconolactonase [Halomonas aquamarina]|uniref:6-phosphogluconolactonase n=1 Tax=Vreelandella aquamarina TaxID=77097 RepID=A0ACC5VY58_9GAMM|nr:6-phosphogluconolactonase [Halomonas aquamarina]MBZ5489017.1 6-phosphogluconolactonase [Halomonas aquamarina]
MTQARQQLAEQLAEAVAKALEEDLGRQERVLLIVSGGSTPVPFFQALAAKPLAWERVDITLADERWVDAESSDSNARLVRENLLQGNAAAAHFVPLTSSASTPEEGVAEVARRTAGLAWPASVIILGMGGDGHTASLFPDSQELGLALATDEPLVAVRTPSQPQPRITFSAARLHQASRHILHITGDDKRTVLASALSGDDVRQLPIRAFLSCPLAIYWAP